MLILLPPSESKEQGGSLRSPSLSHDFLLPIEIACSSSEKDLKCTGKRFAEAVDLNNNIKSGPYMPAHDRYNGVMYKAIDYDSMTDQEQEYYNKHVAILSGLYGVMRPTDIIANYKLPITTSLAHYWKKNITDWLNTHESEVIIDLLTGPYRKMINRNHIQAKVIQVQFLRPDGSKYTHGIKKVKGQWLKQQCKSGFENFDKNRDNINIIM